MVTGFKKFVFFTKKSYIKGLTKTSFTKTIKESFKIRKVLKTFLIFDFLLLKGLFQFNA